MFNPFEILVPWHQEEIIRLTGVAKEVKEPEKKEKVETDRKKPRKSDKKEPETPEKPKFIQSNMF